MSISALPTELRLFIIAHLPILERTMLRIRSRHFYSIIPKHDYCCDGYNATYILFGPEALLRRVFEGLKTNVANGAHLVYCNSCRRLRFRSNFGSTMHLRDPGTQFCVECGVYDWWGFDPFEEGLDRGSEEEKRIAMKFRYKDEETWDPNGLVCVLGDCHALGHIGAMPVEIDPQDEFDGYGRGFVLVVYKIGPMLGR